MSFEALQERLVALQETTSQLKELIDRLAGLKFAPGSVPLGRDEDDNVAAELGTEISQILREEEEDLELLQEEIADLRTGRPGSDAAHSKARLKEGVARLEAELTSCRVAFRRAQLAARHNLDEAQRLERALLLASYAATSPTTRSGASSPAPGSGGPASGTQSLSQSQTLFPPNYVPPHLRHRRRRDGKPDDGGDPDAAAMAASSDVTAALRRTHDLMTTELARSAFARQTLDESTAALAQLERSYGGLEDALAKSRDLLGVLLSSQKSDSWYLETAFRLLLATLAWLVFRRWLYGPLWWLVWFPVRSVWRTGAAVSKLGGSGGSGGARMEMAGGAVDGGEGAQRVVKMGVDSDAIPTAQVGQEDKRTSQRVGEPGSMLEEVGKIVEGSDGESAGESQSQLEQDGEGAQQAQGDGQTAEVGKDEL